MNIFEKIKGFFFKQKQPEYTEYGLQIAEDLLDHSKWKKSTFIYDSYDHTTKGYFLTVAREAILVDHQDILTADDIALIQSRLADYEEYLFREKLKHILKK